MLRKIISLWCPIGQLFALMAAIFIPAHAAAAGPGKVLDAALLDLSPALIKAAPPSYPANLLRDGEEGFARVELIVDDTGKVVTAQVLHATNPLFGESTVTAVRLWKFRPGRKKGKAVATRLVQEVFFNLREGTGIPDKAINLSLIRGAKNKPLPSEFSWDKPPKNIVGPPAVIYPFEALQRGEKGRAVVRFVIGYDGLIYSPEVREATAPEFGHAAAAMLDVASFVPAEKKNGEPALALVEATVEFSPDGKGNAGVDDVAKDILRYLKEHPEKITAASKLDHIPKIQRSSAPVYPKTLAEQKQPGAAVVEFLIDRDGRVQLPRIVSCSAPEFGYAAVQAVSFWLFEPPQRNGQAVITRVQVPVQFRVQESTETPATSQAADKVSSP